MKHLHIHISVEDIEESIRFYSALFGVEPSKKKPDYAKWMLDDPQVNFAISARGESSGLRHLGVQLPDAAALAAMRERFTEADIAFHGEDDVVCCYAQSSKAWVEDPTGLTWETYHTVADAESYHEQESCETSCACC